jgi:hypothetical protein
MDEKELSITRTALLATHFSVSNAKPLFLFSLQYILLSALSTSILIRAIGIEQAKIAITVATMISAYAWCPIAVAIHRRILIGETLSPLSYFHSFTQFRTIRFYGYTMIFGAIGFAAVALTAELGPYATAFAALIVLTVLFRLSLAFPGIAVDEHRSLQEAFHLLLGSAWRLFVATLLVSAPIVLIEIVGLYLLEGWAATVFASFMNAVIGWLTIAVVSYTYSFTKRRNAEAL